MKYVRRNQSCRVGELTDVVPENQREWEMLAKAFPELLPFKYITVVGDGSIAFKRLLEQIF